jgi:hypothetical protein
MEKHREEIAKFKDLYKRIGSVACPYFGGEKVYFTRNGFNHLLRKGKQARISSEQVERLRLIQYCKKILGSEGSLVEYRSSVRPSTIAQFWGFTARLDKLHVKLVVRQIDTGRKHFFSIFSRKH